MGKIYIEFRSESSQRSVCSVRQGVCGHIVRRAEPFAFEYSPQSFGYIQMRTVRRQEKEEKTSFLPDGPEFRNEFPTIDACIIQNHKSGFLNAEREEIKEIRNLISCYAFGSAKALIVVIAVNHSKNVEPVASLGWYIDILTEELQPYGTYPSVQIWLSSP